MNYNILAAIAVAASAVPAAAQDAAAPAAAAPAAAAPAAASAPVADAFVQMIAARTVADYARRNRDPAAMLVAARMVAEVPQPAGNNGEAAFTPVGLFQEARQLANGDAALLQQIHVAENTEHRGVTSSAFGQGLVRSVQVMNPRGAYQFSVNARGNEPLRIGAIGDLGTNLMIRVLDASGKIVCVDDQGDYAPVCQLRPQSTGQFRVDIVNKSAARSRAVILSN